MARYHRDAPSAKLSSRAFASTIPSSRWLPEIEPTSDQSARPDARRNAGPYARASKQQIALHWETFQEARAISLRIYLYLTMLFASQRFIDFLLTQILVPCQMKEWQWDVLGDNQGILVVILATLPAVLFFNQL